MDIELEYSKTPDAEDSWATVEGAEDLFDDIALWEPGTAGVVYFRLSNLGSLALKYKLAMNFTDTVIGKNAEGKDIKLSEILEFGIVANQTEKFASREAAIAAVKNAKKVSAGYATGEQHMKANAEPSYFALVVYMPTATGNEANYRGELIPEIELGINLVATQDTVESDSFDNQYDAGAEYPLVYPVYPDGVTDASFDANGAVAVDDEGTYYTTFPEALTAGGKIYFKENVQVPQYGPHPSVTKDTVIYANGANFRNDISISVYAAPENSETNVTIYHAKNLVVWGQPSNRGDIWNVTMIGCENNGCGLLMYRGGNVKDQINFVAQGCKTDGYTDSIIHTTASGSVTVIDCEFLNNCAPVNIAKKASGSMDIVVENCIFNTCGKVNLDDDYFAPARFVKNSLSGEMTVLMKNNTFVDTVGTNGDILLGDYRPGKYAFKFPVTIETKNPVMVKSSKESAYSFDGGKVEW